MGNHSQSPPPPIAPSDQAGVATGIEVLAATCEDVDPSRNNNPPAKPRKSAPKGKHKVCDEFTTPSPPLPAMKRRRLNMDPTCDQSAPGTAKTFCLFTVHIDSVEPPVAPTASMDAAMGSSTTPMMMMMTTAQTWSLRMRPYLVPSTQPSICSLKAIFDCILPETFTLKCVGLCTPRY